MSTALSAFFILFVAADAFIAGAVIWHLRTYTLPGWNAAKIAIPLYLLLSAVFFGFALYFFIQIP